MYDMDWGIEPKPKKKRGRKCKYPGGYKEHYRKLKAQQPPKPTGRKKGSRNTPEVAARAGRTNHESSWRRQTSDRSGVMQSSSGYAGDSDYSTPSATWKCAHRFLNEEYNYGVGFGDHWND